MNKQRRTGSALVLCMLIFMAVMLSGCDSSSKIYESALKLMEAGEYSQAAVEFVKLGEYKDSMELLEKAQEQIAENKRAEAYEAAQKLMEAGDLEQASKEFIILGEYKDSREKSEQIMEMIHEKKCAEAYAAALKLEEAGDLEQASYEFFKLGVYGDAGEHFDRIREQLFEEKSAEKCEVPYQKAMEFLAAREYEKAAFIFASITDYKDSKYILDHMNNIMYYDKANDYFAQIGPVVSDVTLKYFTYAVMYYQKAGDWADAKAKEEACWAMRFEDRYQEAVTLVEQGYYKEAWKSLGYIFRTCQFYATANEEDFNGYKAGRYKDTQEMQDKCYDIFESLLIHTSSEEQENNDYVNDVPEVPQAEDLEWEVDIKTGKLVISGHGGIPQNTFWGQFGENDIRSIEINEGITAIPVDAFRFYFGLESISIPSTVISIDEDAFFRCSDLAKIIYNGTKEEWNSIVKHRRWNTGTDFPYTIECTDGILQGSLSSKCGDQAEYRIEDDVLYITGTGRMDSDFDGPWARFPISTIFVGRGITGIGDYAEFDGNYKKIRDIHLPATLTELGFNWIESSQDGFTIYYEGSEEQWERIEKYAEDLSSDSYSLICNRYE